MMLTNSVHAFDEVKFGNFLDIFYSSKKKPTYIVFTGPIVLSSLPHLPAILYQVQLHLILLKTENIYFLYTGKNMIETVQLEHSSLASVYRLVLHYLLQMHTQYG